MGLVSGLKESERSVSEKESDRLKTLEWLAEFVMACPEDSIPIGRQQRLIRELTEMDGLRGFTISSPRESAEMST